MKLRAAVNGFMAQYKLKGYRLDVAVDRISSLYRRRISPVRPDLSLDQKYRLSFFSTAMGAVPLELILIFPAVLAVVKFYREYGRDTSGRLH